MNVEENKANFYTSSLEFDIIKLVTIYFQLALKYQRTANQAIVSPAIIKLNSAEIQLC